MNKKNSQAINLVIDAAKNVDFSLFEQKILNEISEIFEFRPLENIWRSTYWGKNLGASHWRGLYKGKEAVLKIQGAEPIISEVYIINKFRKDNRSKIMRPPIIYNSIPWNKDKGYESILMEYVNGQKVLQYGKVLDEKDINLFLNYYLEYKERCVPLKPWLKKPEKFDYKTNVESLISLSLKNYPNHPHRNKNDFELAKKAAKVLQKYYQKTNLVFMHGHFSGNDLIYKDKNKEEVVIFSNLFWKWKYPFYDGVFAYHWFIYELSKVPNITSETVEQQRNIYLKCIHEKLMKNEIDVQNLKLALLERAVAGLIVDSFLIDTNLPISKYLVETTRDQVKKYINELS